jgi:predicted lipoprotein with Yx(FWY)xxD motif
MRTSRLALAVSLPIAVLLAAGCRGTEPVAGAAYGATTAAAATSPAPAASASAMGSATAAASGAPMIPAKAVLTISATKVGYVLATADGMTVYWYGKDVKGNGQSACTGSCAAAWPPVTGAPVAAPGVRLSGTLGAITLPDGVVQATYNGYPLYRYAADVSRSQATGNGAGGVWHVITGNALSAAY